MHRYFSHVSYVLLLKHDSNLLQLFFSLTCEMRERERVHLFLIGKDATTKKKNINSVIFHLRQCRPFCERLRNNVSPIPGEIGAVVEFAACHRFLTL